ncbi:MAG: cation-transporting P-type ATPase [Candidatus Acidiferrum sp.]
MSSDASETHAAMTGLTAEEAQARLDQFGPNEPAATKHYSFLSDLLHAFANPLVLILVIAAAASAFLGEKVDAGIIGTIVLLSIVIDLSQTYRSVADVLWILLVLVSAELVLERRNALPPWVVANAT